MNMEIFLSFLVNIVLGCIFYILDVYTDIKLSLNMFKEFSRNYTYTIETCHRTLVNNLRSALTVGNSSSFTDCLDEAKLAI